MLAVGIIIVTDFEFTDHALVLKKRAVAVSTSRMNEHFIAVHIRNCAWLIFFLPVGSALWRTEIGSLSSNREQVAVLLRVRD